LIPNGEQLVYQKARAKSQRGMQNVTVVEKRQTDGDRNAMSRQILTGRLGCHKSAHVPNRRRSISEEKEREMNRSLPAKRRNGWVRLKGKQPHRINQIDELVGEAAQQTGMASTERRIRSY